MLREETGGVAVLSLALARRGDGDEGLSGVREGEVRMGEVRGA